MPINRLQSTYDSAILLPVMNTLYIIIPAYNEEKNINTLIADWYPVITKYGDPETSRLVLIDDGSKDSTYDTACRLKVDHPLLEVLTKENSGHASTCMYGYRYAIEHGADYVFQTDSDGQTLPGEFGPFYDAIADHDVVMGVRMKRGDGTGRLIISRVLRMVVKLTYHVSVPDSNVPYRLMRSDALAEALKLVPQDYTLAQVVLAAVFEKLNKRTCYLPISFVSREAGESMYNIGKFFRIGFNALGEFVSINRDIDAKMKTH